MAQGAQAFEQLETRYVGELEVQDHDPHGGILGFAQSFLTTAGGRARDARRRERVAHRLPEERLLGDRENSRGDIGHAIAAPANPSEDEAREIFIVDQLVELLAHERLVDHVPGACEIRRTEAQILDELLHHRV